MIKKMFSVNADPTKLSFGGKLEWKSLHSLRAF